MSKSITEKVSTRSSWFLINNFNYIFDFRYHNGRIGRFILTINSTLYIMNGRPADTHVWESRDSPGNTCIAVYVIEFSHVGGGMSIHMMLCRKRKGGSIFQFLYANLWLQKVSQRAMFNLYNFNWLEFLSMPTNSAVFYGAAKRTRRP